ncbi:MAG: hypothetical protein ACI4WG_04150 [Erysipelotrichaceae bacterium]
MDYVYLDNQKRSKSLLFVLVGLCLVLSIVNLIMFFTGSVMTPFMKAMLIGSDLSFIILAGFLMLYLRRNQKDKFLLLLLHVVQFHLIFTSATVLVGTFADFSFYVMHGILDAVVLMILYVLAFGKLHVLSAILLAILSVVLTIYQYNSIYAIVMVVFAAVALLTLIKNSKQLHFVYGILVVVVSLLASILTFVYGYNIVHVVMHYIINHATFALCVIIFAIKPLKAENNVEETKIETASKAEEEVQFVETTETLKQELTEQPTENQQQTEQKNRWIIKKYQNLPLKQLMDAPVDALWGISKEDKDLLKSAFNIKTVKDLATNKWFKMAEDILEQADNQKD